MESIDFNVLEDYNVAIENQFLRARSECLKDDIFPIKDNIFFNRRRQFFFMLDFLKNLKIESLIQVTNDTDFHDQNIS